MATRSTHRHSRPIRAIVGALVLTSALVAAVALLLLGPALIVKYDGDDGLTAADRAKQMTEERRSILALLAAIGAGAGLYYTHQRHQLERDGNRTDRYTKAVEQLGNESPDVQLGGIYALERIAQDSVRDRSVVGEVLAAFVREHSPRPAKSSPARRDVTRLLGRRSPRGDDAPATIPHSPAPTTIKAALTVLGRRPLNDRSYRPADLIGAGLSGVHLPGANLSAAIMRDVDLSGAFLSGAHLEEADLRGADLSLARLHETNLARAELNDAKLMAADLYGADLRGAILHNADLTNANLTKADLTGAMLYGAQLEQIYGADLAHADFRSPFSSPTDERETPDEPEAPGRWVRVG